MITAKMVLFGALNIFASGGETFVVESTPLGEAPAWVRESWVGLTLPFVDIALCGIGVLSGTVTDDPPILSYRVPEADAISLLQVKSPTAAQWWREHQFPSNGRYFCFSAPINIAKYGVL
jgi:hypothetical protein